MGYYTQADLERFRFRKLGKNVKISEKASIYGAEKISIGDHSRIDDFCVLSAGDGGIEIGRYVHIAVYSSLIGQAKIVMKDFSGLSSRVSIYSSTDDYSGEALTNPTVPTEFLKIISKEVVLEKHVIVGAGAIILPGCRLQEGSAVGAQSLLTKDCEPFTIYAGVPAKRIKARSRKLLELEKNFLGETNV